MILPTMNRYELAKEIFSDYEVVERKAGYLMKNVEKIAKKRKRKEYHAVFPYNSLRRNNWTIILWYTKKYLHFQTFLQYTGKRGYHAVFVYPEDQKLAFHSTHFLQRYNERFLQSDISNKSELMLEFTCRNPLATVVDITDKGNNDTKLFAYLNDGIGLGYKYTVSDYTFEYMKTFISKDMIHSGQELYAGITSEQFEIFMNRESHNYKIKSS